jgi:hypothetical protein
MASWAPARVTQKDPDLDQPCAQLPPGPGGIGCGRGCANANDDSAMTKAAINPMI